ncbi:hypothetical protein TNIN_311991 [Trichonephila inaurata madagascariensis]|uniref:Uncharacterized protein n=1 Tax=Trichonephila inaurata madagascariensis TaxID=2747483 RepID=A0A8X7BQH5_9ARAC|nr:hypothetical protein TNIN_311991 [Trichonephila inaurata madagascariensis]
MAMVLNDCTIEVQRAVVQIYVRNDFPKRIFIKKCYLFVERSVYLVKQCTMLGAEIFTRPFKIVDEDQSGDPVLSATKSTEQQVEELIRDN